MRGQGWMLATVAVLLGDLHFMRGALDGSADAYQRALGAAPGLVAAEVALARWKRLVGRPVQRFDRLSAVVDRFPQPDAVGLLGDLHASAGNEQLARQQYTLARTIARLQEAAGQNVDLELALLEADRADDAERALDLARRAHAARPDNVYAAGALAWAMVRAGRAQEAVEPMEAALRLGTADPLVGFHAAEVFAAVGDDAHVRDELAAALDTTPWFFVAHRERAGQLAGQLGVPRPQKGSPGEHVAISAVGGVGRAGRGHPRRARRWGAGPPPRQLHDQRLCGEVTLHISSQKGVQTRQD